MSSTFNRPNRPVFKLFSEYSSFTYFNVLKNSIFIIFVLVLCASYPVASRAVSFQGLGDLSGGVYKSSTKGVSADGLTVVGVSSSAIADEIRNEAFVWTLTEGIQGLGVPEGRLLSEASGISNDGSVIVGRTIHADSSSGKEAFRWTLDGGMQDIGDFVGGAYDSNAIGVSGNGNTVIGYGRVAWGVMAMYWSMSKGMTGIDNDYSVNSIANAVTDNGAVIVGKHEVQKAIEGETITVKEAFRWQQNTGITGIGFLAFPPGTYPFSIAYDVTPDGSVIVGNSGYVLNGQAMGEAFRWTTSDGMQGLGTLRTDIPSNSTALGVSADGSVVVGYTDTDEIIRKQAFIWTEKDGMRTLSEVLINEAGLNLAGWKLVEAIGISADGLTIVGNGVNPNKELEAWIIKLDSISLNRAPIAYAGPDQTVISSTVVQLNSSASNDLDADYPLVYAWQMVDKPVGSVATLSNLNIVNPIFITDKPGEYVVGLVVTDSRGRSSVEDRVVVSTINSVPVANAGTDQLVIEHGFAIQLDGSESSDADLDPLTYSWSFVSRPDGSAAALSDPYVVNPVFVVDEHGDYVIRLIVTDGYGVTSNADEVVVSFNNILPVADAGLDQDAVAGDIVQLAGSGSDANLDPITYKWNIVSMPEGSQAALPLVTVENIEFVPDVAGPYVFSLIVNDGFENGLPDNVMIIVASVQDTIFTKISALIDLVSATEPDNFKKNRKQSKLLRKINKVLDLIGLEKYRSALKKLQRDILRKQMGVMYRVHQKRMIGLPTVMCNFSFIPKLMKP